MTKSVLITGASGMVGRGVLLECIDNPIIDRIVLVNRRPLDIKHDKVEEIILEDFMSLDDLDGKLAGLDACFFCLGTSAAGMSEEEYTRITYDLTIGFAQVFQQQNPDATFCYVSGAGTSGSEQSRMMWARVKGKTENALLAMPFKRAYMFRPGFIQPMRGIKSRTVLYQTFYQLFRPIYGVLRHFPSAATSTTNTGKAMIATILSPQEERILDNRAINRLAEKLQVHSC